MVTLILAIRLISMKRAIKILLGMGCFLLFSQLSLYPEAFFDTDSDVLYPIVSSIGFVMMMVTGFYGIFKMLRPFVCHKEEQEVGHANFLEV
ncbi:hypothetical protein [Mucilaginibacter sp.]|uniref:hypothetical protein n=1 Tax=Mucilaginibacter sp. TaxID=1882438 RepID=UPI003D0D49B2